MNTKAVAMALFTVIIWGSSFASIRAGFQGGYTAGHFVLVRYLVASGVFILYALLPGVKIRMPQKNDFLRILLLGWIGISIYHMGVTFGEKTISAGTAGMLIGSGPIFTALLAVVILKEHLGIRGWAGLIIGFAGIVIITIGSSGSSLKISAEAIYILIGAFASSMLFVYQKPLLKQYSSIELTAYFTWAGTLPFLLFFPGLFQNIHHATLEANLSALYVGILPTAIGYATWAIALTAGKASSVSSFLYIEPVVAVLVAWVWLHEWPGTLSIIGGIITIVGVTAVNFKGKKQHQTLSEKTKLSEV